MDNIEYIDYDGFENRTLNDIQVQEELLNLSIGLFNDYHVKLNEALANIDYDALFNIAHKAKTGAALMGFQNLHAAYQNIESEARLQKQNSMSFERINQLIKAFNNCSEKLKTYINSKKI